MFYGNQNDNLVQRFEDWWNRDNKGLPLMDVLVRRDDAVWSVPRPKDPAGLYTDVEWKLASMRETMRNVIYMGDSFAHLSANLGPGSMALYLGSEPRFAPDTVWYEPSILNLDSEPEIRFDPENKWWKKHLDMHRVLKAAAGKDFLVDIPDIIENIDIYAAMRGPQPSLYDLMDDPEIVERTVHKIDDLYFNYYDALLDIVKDEEAGISSYTAFEILGKGRVAKIQCDFSAMISPKHYRRFVLPGLQAQTKKLDHSLYHLDGPDAVKHVPAIMEIEDLDALQWTCGAGQPDGACPRWYVIYDQVAEAGKGLWVQLYDGGIDDWIKSADTLMEKYGKKRFYFHFPWMSQKEAEKLFEYAHRHWEAD